jgi:uncharacterized protein YbjT (DUF2867 family)
VPYFATTDVAVEVAQEVIDALVSTKKHDILLLSRKVRILFPALRTPCISSLHTDIPAQGIPAEEAASGVTWIKANYQDTKQLAKILKDVDTVLSFVTVQSDPGSIAQKNLIDAAVQAGVKRFAPSEWAT